jgi:hypothetical protein
MKAAFQAMLDMAGTPFSCADLLNRLGDRDQKIVSELTFQQVSTEPAEAAAQALDCLRILESRTAEERFVKLKREIREAEQSGNVAEAMRLMGELESMRRQQKAV